MWKPLLCLFVATAAVTLSSGGRVRQRAPNFYNFRPEFISDDEQFIPLEASNFPGFGLKAAIDAAVQATEAYNNEDSSGQQEESDSKTAAATPAEDKSGGGGDGGNTSGDSSSEEDTKDLKPEHRSVGVVKDYSKSHSKKRKTDWDASYAFGYDLEDQSRHETSDPNGNVNGFYSFIDDEGITRKIVYTAGAGKGFVVLNKEKSRKEPSKGNHVTVHHGKHQGGGGVSHSAASSSSVGGGGDGDEDNVGYPGRPWGALAIKNTGKDGKRKKPIFVVKIRRPVKKNPPLVYFRPRPANYPHKVVYTLPAHSPALFHRPSNYLPYPVSYLSAAAPIARLPIPPPPYGGDDDEDWQEPAASTGIKDASYSFAYDTGSSNRKEVADPWGNVRGSYSYIDPAGIRRTVNYIAGGTTGFKILSASPTVVENVYEQAPPPFVTHHHRHPQTPRSRHGQSGGRRLHPILASGPVEIPAPSAIVYHIHPDGGWKPWEPKKGRRHSRKRAHPTESTTASELTNEVLVDPVVTTPSSGPDQSEVASVLVQTHPDHSEISESPMTTTVTAAEPQSSPAPRRHSGGQRSYTADDGDNYSGNGRAVHFYHSGEFDDDGTLFSPNYALPESFSLAEDSRRPFGRTDLNIGFNQGGFGHRNSFFLASESKNSAVVGASGEEEGASKEMTANKEQMSTTSMMTSSTSSTRQTEAATVTTMSTTQVEKPSRSRKNPIEGEIEVTPAPEATIVMLATTESPLPSPRTPSPTSAPSSSRRSAGGGSGKKKNKPPSQTVLRMTRDETTNPTVTTNVDSESHQQSNERISSSGRLVKRLAVTEQPLSST